MTPLRALLVESAEEEAQRWLRALHNGGYTVACERVETPEAMAEAVGRGSWDIVLCGSVVPGASSAAVIELLRARGSEAPVVILGNEGGVEHAVQAIKSGAQEYLLKADLGRLVPAVQQVLHEAWRGARPCADSRRDAAAACPDLAEQWQVSTALLGVGRALLQPLEWPVLLERLACTTVETLGCDCSHTLLLEPATHTYAIAAGAGDSPEQWEAIRVLKVPRAAVGGLVARLERDEIVPLGLSEPQDLLPANLLRQYGITAGLFAALRRGNELIGIHSAGYRGRAAPFDRQQGHLMRGIAQIASLASEHARVRDDLERANRLKYDFVATMSHELRTPLNVIMGYSDLLIEGTFGALSPDQLDALRRVTRSGRQLLELINTTLDLGRLDAGRLELQIREVRLADLVREIDAETQDVRQKPGVRFEWQLLVTTAVAVHRSVEAQGGAQEPHRQRHEVHRVGWRHREHPDARARRRDCGQRHRHRDRARGAADHLRAVPPGRQLDDAALWRRRPRPLHRAAPRRSARWDDQPSTPRWAAARRFVCGCRAASAARRSWRERLPLPLGRSHPARFRLALARSSP